MQATELSALTLQRQYAMCVGGGTVRLISRLIALSLNQILLALCQAFIQFQHFKIGESLLMVLLGED